MQCLSRYLLETFSQKGVVPPQKKKKFPAVKTTTFDFLSVNLVSYIKKHHTASPNGQQIT